MTDPHRPHQHQHQHHKHAPGAHDHRTDSHSTKSHSHGDQHRRFDALAADWDEQPGSVERAATIAQAVRAAVRLSPSMTVLEIGAGTGLLSRALAGEVGRAVVTDVAEGMVAVATQALAQPRFSGWRAERLDIEHDPLPQERFDLILSQLALHHMGSIETVLGRLFELLRPGCQVALADLEYDADGGFHRHVTDFHGHPGFTREQLAGWLRQAGFIDVAVTHAGHDTKEVDGVQRRFPILLATGSRPAAVE